MISVADLIHIPYHPGLTEGGIAYALRSLAYNFHRATGSPYDRLRRGVAGAAVELAFRRYLSGLDIPFEVKSALPFTERDRYDVLLGGRRCEIKSFLISHRDRIAEIQGNPQTLLNAPALVASDQHAGDGHSHHDLYLFAFLSGLVTASQTELQKAVEARQPHYLVHLMPEAWSRPSTWNPLGKLALKSEADEPIAVDLSGHGRGHEIQSCSVVLPPRTRLEIQTGYFSLSHVHVNVPPRGRIAIHSPVCKQTYMIGASDWGNLWIDGKDVWLAGYITRDEFSRRARFVQPGTQVFQYNHTQLKNLAVPVSELRPLSDLFDGVQVRAW